VWNKLMTYAHTGIELKPIPFVEPEVPADDAEAAVADAGEATLSAPVPAAAGVLTALTTARLTQIERLFQTAPRLQPIADLRLPSSVTVAATPEAGTPSPTAAP
jgi:penicillin-binding protein 1A